METKISTGTAVMDWLLEGGYDKSVITTIYGPAGSGKSNLCLLCIANSVKGQKIIFIDTEGNFSLTRFKQLCPDYKKVLERIMFLKPTNFREQRASIAKLKALIKQDIGIIFVDSISSLYRAALQGEDNRGINNAMAAQVHDLLEIARKKDIPVIMTAQVYADFEEKGKVNLVGGTILRNMSKCLIELKNSGPNRIAIIRKHRSIEEGKSIMFRIVDEGIKEVER
ncbi:MAG TPA: DNA repair and recombination protein RadB [Candidatus Nanoarchaeia archaeon]|nr:DNA repair and recombination protein RadB [Candidatus Nanoarchaeia archaeon]